MNEDATGTQAGDYTVHPTGATSTLTVHGFGPRADLRVLARKNEPGAPLLGLTADTAREVSPGTYCVWTTVQDRARRELPTQAQCDVQVAAGSAVEYTLGQVSFARSCSDKIFAVDVESGSSTNLGWQSEPVPHAAGSFFYQLDSANTFGWDGRVERYNSLNVLKGTVTEGATTTVDPCDVTNRQKLRLVPPSQRELPNIENDYNARYTFELVEVGDDKTHTSAVTLGVSFDKPLLVYAPGDAPSYALRVSGNVIGPLATAQEPMKEIQLGRIDVADVDVTKADGSHVAVHGTFAISGNGFSMSSFATGHGLDVFPGTYKVDVAYTHPVDGAPMKESYSVTVP
jgi:hypothetical protein